MNLIQTTTAAYNAGLAGLPEPAKVTKHVQMMDGEGVTLTAQVETEASLRNRLAWAQAGKASFEVWIERRLVAVEQKLAEMNFHAGPCSWLCFGAEGHDESTARMDAMPGLCPELLEDEEAFANWMKNRGGK